MVIWIATGINQMKKVNKGLIASLLERIGFPFSKVRRQTNVAVLLLDFLYKMLITVKKLMVKTMAKTVGKTMEIGFIIERFGCIYLLIIYRLDYIDTFQFSTILIIHTFYKITQFMYG